MLTGFLFYRLDDLLERFKREAPNRDRETENGAPENETQDQGTVEKVIPEKGSLEEENMKLHKSFLSLKRGLERLILEINEG